MPAGPSFGTGRPTSNIAVLTFFHSNRYALAEAGLFEGNVLAIADLDREHVLTRRQLHIDDRRAIAEVNPRVRFWNRLACRKALGVEADVMVACAFVNIALGLDGEVLVAELEAHR